MAGAPQVDAQVQAALAAGARCASAETTQNYDAFVEALAELGETAKRSCEGHADYRALLGKLRAGEALSADDRAALRRLVVGDADYYLKYDEEFDRCKSEIARISSEIQSLQTGGQTGGFTVDTLMRVNVLCREAGGLAALAEHYLDARERVQRFEAATGGAIDRDSGRALADMIQNMVA